MTLNDIRMSVSLDPQQHQRPSHLSKTDIHKRYMIIRIFSRRLRLADRRTWVGTEEHQLWMRLVARQ